jgi:type III secretion system (T3SS) SseB-like protein
MTSPRVPADPTPVTDLTSPLAYGGTFVRPGAFAWGPPGALTPSADSVIVEDALAIAVKDHDRVADLLDELRRGRLWLPLPDGDGPVTDGSAVHLPTVTYLGAEFVPAFTSASRLAAWPGGGLIPAQAQPDVVPHIVVPAAELARLLPPGLGIAINPGAEASVPVYPDGVAYLSGGNVQVGHPPADPVDLLGVVRESLRVVPAVTQAARAWLSVPGHGEGLVISVALRDPASAAAHHAVIDAIEQAAATVPHQFPIDVTFPGEGEPDQVDEWIAATAEPFYIRD